MSDYLTELTKLKDYTHCPYCFNESRSFRSKVIAEGRESQHCSGEWREYRVFECGFKVRYNTNFRRVEIESTCTESEAYKQKIQARTVAKEKLIRYIGTLKIDKDAKARLTDSYEVKNLNKLFF